MFRKIILWILTFLFVFVLQILIIVLCQHFLFSEEGESVLNNPETFINDQKQRKKSYIYSGITVYGDTNITNELDKILKKWNINPSVNIIINNSLYFKNGFNSLGGFYWSGNIVIFTQPSFLQVYYTLDHEFGHYIWDKYISEEDKYEFSKLGGWFEKEINKNCIISSYGMINELEDFAEFISYKQNFVEKLIFVKDNECIEKRENILKKYQNKTI